MENGTHLKLKKFNWSDLNVNNVNTFPLEKDLAGLSYAVYYQEYGSKFTYDISESGEDEAASIQPLSDSWRLIATARSKILSWSLSLGDGYHGAAYYNVSSSHLVIVHRGTDLTNIGSLWADIKGVTLSGFTSQVKSAYEFTRQVVDRFWDCAISITVTGHSLGGWLSQMSAFFMKHPDLADLDFGGSEGNLTVDFVAKCQRDSAGDRSTSRNHLHVVAFDSPGALAAIEEYMLRHHPRYPDNRFSRLIHLNDLDVTTYLSYPNTVNVVKMHTGSLFMMQGIDTHKMKNILQFWQSDEPAEKRLLKVTDWLKSVTESNLHPSKVDTVDELRNAKFSTETVDVNSVRMSIFESEERQLLEDIRHVRNHIVIGELVSWETIFENESIAAAFSAIFSGGEFVGYTEAKNIFELFDSFDIVKDRQVLKVDHKFKIEFFIRLVKHFVRNFNLQAMVKEVISDFPKIYQAFYRALNNEYLNDIVKVRADDFPLLTEFLESSRLRVYQAIAEESSVVCVAEIVNLLTSKSFRFNGDVDAKLDMKHVLFLNSDLLSMLDRHVSIAKVVTPNDNLKLIVIENVSEIIQPKLRLLIDKVIDTAHDAVKLILVTRKKIDFLWELEMDISPFYLEAEIGVSDQSISLDCLLDEHRAKILDTEILFQGEDVQLKNLVPLEYFKSPDASVRSFLHNLLSPTSKISFGGCFNTLNEFERSYYIPRHFHKVALIETKKLYKMYHKKFVLIVSYDDIDFKRFFNAIKRCFEWQGSLKGFDRERHEVILVESSKQLPSYQHFRLYFKEMGLSALWTTYDSKSNKWYWQSTFGTKDKMDLTISYESRYNEQEMLDQQHQQLVIITDEPGMGKSTILKNLAEVSKQRRRDADRACWVIFVNLDSHADPLRELKESRDLESVTKFLLHVDGSSSSSPVPTSILKYLLQQEGRVTIFIDGLDEVVDLIQTKVMEIVTTLLDQTKAKIFLASRVHLRSTLEEKFVCYSNTFLPLDNQEKVEFLTKFWIDHPTLHKLRDNAVSADVILSTYARHLLAKLRLSLNIEQMDAFIGVPLQLFMLGTVSLPNVSSFLSQVESNAGHITDSMLENDAMLFDNIFDLYRKFVEEKFHIFLKEKLNLKQLAENSPWLYQQSINSLSEPHRTIAFRFCFPDEFQEFDTGDSLSNIQVIEVMLSVGIVHSYSIDMNSINFIHRSLAEYFAADFLVSRLATSHWKRKVVDFLRKNYFHPQFEKIRFFIDHFLTLQPNCHPIFRKCLNFEKEKLAIFNELNRNENVEIYDPLGRNVLHYAICYGNHEEGILWCLTQNEHLFDKTDAFGCDFSSYLVLIPNIKVLTLFTFYYLAPNEQVMFMLSGKKQNLIAELLSKNVREPEAITELIAEDDKSLLLSEKQILYFLQIIRSIDAQNDRYLFSDYKRPCQSSDKIHLFTNLVLKYCKRPDNYLKTFEVAMMTNSEVHLRIAIDLFEIVNGDIETEILSLMVRNASALFKNCISPDKVLYFERHLWLYCEQERKGEEEMLDFVQSTDFQTFRTTCSTTKGFMFRGFQAEQRCWRKRYHNFYKKIKNQKALDAMKLIVENGIHEMWEGDFLFEWRSVKFDSFKDCNSVKFDWMWKFLLPEDKERVLNKCADRLSKYITEKSQSVDPSTRAWAKEFIQIIRKSVKRGSRLDTNFSSSNLF